MGHLIIDHVVYTVGIFLHVLVKLWRLPSLELSFPAKQHLQPKQIHLLTLNDVTAVSMTCKALYYY